MLWMLRALLKPRILLLLAWRALGRSPVSLIAYPALSVAYQIDVAAMARTGSRHFEYLYSRY
jgi:hypothetical protein